MTALSLSIISTSISIFLGIALTSCIEERTTTNDKQQEPRGLIPTVIVENIDKLKNQDVIHLVISDIQFIGLDDPTTKQIRMAISERFRRNNQIATGPKLHLGDEGELLIGEKKYFSVKIIPEFTSQENKKFAGKEYHEFKIELSDLPGDPILKTKSRTLSFLGYWPAP